MCHLCSEVAVFAPRFPYLLRKNCDYTCSEVAVFAVRKNGCDIDLLTGTTVAICSEELLAYLLRKAVLYLLRKNCWHICFEGDLFVLFSRFCSVVLFCYNKNG